jgi:hypothetical protein
MKPMPELIRSITTSERIDLGSDLKSGNASLSIKEDDNAKNTVGKDLEVVEPW